MSSLDTTIIIDGITIPKYSEIKRILVPNETDIRTLGGNLYTDFRNNTRTWVISWERMTREDYEIIYNLYKNQYTSNNYSVVRMDAYDISIPAKIEISEQNIKWNGSIIEGFSITIKEQFAFS